MSWSFPWASSFGTDFNDDYPVSMTENQQRSGAVEYTFRIQGWRPGPDGSTESPAGTEWATDTRGQPGMSAFALDDGAVYHPYSAYAPGLDGLCGAYQWLDRAPLGRNETGFRWGRHEENESE